MTLSVNWMMSEAKLKEELETAVKNLAFKNNDNLAVVSNNNVINVYTNELDKLDISKHNLVGEIKNLLQNEWLVKYSIEENKEREISNSYETNEIIRMLIEDFSKEAKLNIDNLDSMDEGQLDNALRNILTNLTADGKTINVNFTLKDDTNTTTEKYSIVFHNSQNMTNNEKDQYENTFNVIMQATKSTIEATQKRNKKPRFKWYYDNKACNVDFYEKYYNNDAIDLARTGFKTAVIHLLTGGWYPSAKPQNVPERRKVQKDLQQVKITQDGKSAIISKKQLNAIIEKGDYQEAGKPFIEIFMPEGKNVTDLHIKDFVNQSAELEYTYIDANNKKCVITRKLIFGSYTD